METRTPRRRKLLHYDGTLFKEVEWERTLRRTDLGEWGWESVYWSRGTERFRRVRRDEAVEGERDRGLFGCRSQRSDNGSGMLECS